MTQVMSIPIAKLTDTELMTLIAEEACEIGQAATKIMRFGISNHNPNFPTTDNFTALIMEYRDLRELMEELGSRTGHDILKVPNTHNYRMAMR